MNRFTFAFVAVGWSSGLFAQTWVETAQIPPAPGNLGDLGLALDGARLIRGGHIAATNSAFDVLEWDGASWSQTAQVQGPANQGLFGKRFSLDGDSLLVADQSDDGAVGVGIEPAAYYYEHSGASWILKQKLSHTGGTPGDWFGTHVLLAGDEAFVTACFWNTNQGSIFVYKKDQNGLFQQTQQLLPESSSDVQEMGWNGVAVDGGTLVASGSGRFFIFEKQQGVWVRTATFLDYPALGYAVAAANGRVFVTDKTQTNWEVGVYAKVAGAWVQTTTILAPPSTFGFGGALSASGDELVVSASNLSQYGVLHVFKQSMGQWTEQQKLESDSPSTYFTNVFARSENRIAVSDSQNTTHVFELCTSSPQTVNYGAGKPGFYGVPQLQSDLPELGATATITLSNASAGLGVLFIGFQAASYPFDGGQLLVEPFTSSTFIIPFGGSPTFAIPIPVHAALCGFDVYFQSYVIDASAGGAFHTAQTPGLHWVIGA